MLSSVVNSLTYRVLSTCVFTYLWHFLSMYTHFCDKKLWHLSTFFGEIWLNCGWYFLHSLLEHFLEKAYCLCSVWFPNQQKCVYFGFFGMILYCFVVRLFYVLFRIIYHMFCSFFSSKIMCFHVFRNTIIIMISPSGTASYMTESW